MRSIDKLNAVQVIRDAENLPRFNAYIDLWKAVCRLFKNNLYPPCTLMEILGDEDNLGTILFRAIILRYVRRHPNQEMVEKLRGIERFDLLQGDNIEEVIAEL